VPDLGAVERPTKNERELLSLPFVREVVFRDLSRGVKLPVLRDNYRVGLFAQCVGREMNPPCAHCQDGRGAFDR
jgi:hypothetical protein